MAPGLENYAGDGEHTHAQRIPFIVWATLVGLVVLALTVAGLGLYLSGRAATANTRNENTAEAICAILNALPAGSARTPARERHAFRTAYTLEMCRPVPTRPLKPTPHPTPPAPSLSAAPRTTVRSTTVVIRPRATPHPTRTIIRPTRTVTKHPTPKPSPSKTCQLGVLGICLH